MRTNLEPVTGSDPIGALEAHHPDAVRLEGFHALKHALRFGAHVLGCYTGSKLDTVDLAMQLAPDVVERMEPMLVEVPASLLRMHSNSRIHTGVLSFAVRRSETVANAMPKSGRPSVLLDDPRNLGNVGAVIRVAAATGCSGVLLSNELDPFDPMITRGAAGLQFAVPVVSLRYDMDALRSVPLIAFDAGGDRFDPASAPGPVVFAFGSERAGISDEVRRRADKIVSLPMETGVSSLNLATSVSAAIYARRYALGEGAAYVS